MTARPLHAVQFRAADGEQMLAALGAALDGSGPAIMPLDPDLPAPALARILEAFSPAVLTTTTSTGTDWHSLSPPPHRAPGLAGATALQPDTAVVIATSGSTGKPKAVELSAAALTASAAASLDRIGAGPGERWLCCLPFFHVSGLGVLTRSLLAGTTPVFAERVTPEVIAGCGCQRASLVPTQLRRLLDSACPAGPLKSVLVGGAAPGGALLSDARAAGWPVITTYGMSETCGGCVYSDVPVKGVQVRIADDLIEIAGPVLFSGYLGQPELTAAVLSGGWFRTADLGAWRADGTLAVRGRADEVITTGGEKVVPGEVEAVLGTAAGVAGVVVVGLPDREWGEAVTAVVVPADPASPPGLDALRLAVRNALPAYSAPRNVVFVPEFPLLPSGKPDRLAVRRMAARDLNRA